MTRNRSGAGGPDQDANAPDFSRSAAHKKGISRQVDPARALVVHPYLKAPPGGDTPPRTPEERLEEAVGLASAINLEIADSLLVPLATQRSSTLFGTGKVEELAGQIAQMEIEVVIVDSALTPAQQRNLEKAWNTKVLDRTGLILEIFGARARTREGTLQVELAHLIYQKSRLVRSWTHLERQRGGLGTVGGPGETQIEADRRLIQERITKIRRQLETVTRTRQLHRASRKKVPYPIVALVGYTNAGKSTLFNRLTEADVMARDMLFATLDPSMRALDLPGGQRIILSDTVGFISDLPTQLVAAFRATLEEVLEADILLHVRDISSNESDAQARDVAEVLRELGIGENDERPVIEVLNKADLLPGERREAIERRLERAPNAATPPAGPRDAQVLVSAHTGEGVDALVGMIGDLVNADRTVLSLEVDPSDGAMLAWLHENTDILERTDSEDGRITLTIGLSSPALGRLRKRLGETEETRVIGLAAD